MTSMTSHLCLLICNCHNSETLGREALRSSGVKDYLAAPCYKGKPEALSFISTLPDTLATHQLRAFVEHNSKYVLVVAHGPLDILWANFDADITEKAKAIAIAKQFCD